ncbi:hypothetical protein L5G28_07740 [Gordonia sp. HY285]|uniref:hypothetical protein n=1 Tax=Gordonia liuliyuniae TaxID=2911517 RepID=UPI001F22160A|nr:hypothetical protein [Gordonia liuliyuniae]MCF8610053.1 hypothetical protein [Gordonia liuliyuniae]
MKTLQALTAAGVRFTTGDFSDPKLDRPTALTVTADGRVFGHLASWGTCHIGHTGQCVTPPSSERAYQYFHQGVVSTPEGDLPVGKITLGTGHAALGESATTAAAHYDNTGSTVAVARAGEDEHGIWLAGRIVPGTPPERIDELRRSGVSGDWRGIDGSMELVAALAVNVPGFPVPRTEQLVAAGGVQTLVAAGVVAPPSMPSTQDEFDAMVSALVDGRVAAAMSGRERLQRARSSMESLVASANADRRAAAVDEMERVAAARAGESMDLTAAVPGHMPGQLHRYWTKGAGLARWAESPHPYTSLVHALKREIKGKPDSAIKGLAANLFKSVFGIWPGERKGDNPVGPGSGAVVAAGRRVRSKSGADRYGVGVGDLIPKAILDAQKNAGKAAAKAGEDVADLIDPDRKKDDGKKDDGKGGDAPKKDAPKPDDGKDADKPKDVDKPDAEKDGGKDVGGLKLPPAPKKDAKPKAEKNDEHGPAETVGDGDPAKPKPPAKPEADKKPEPPSEPKEPVEPEAPVPPAIPDDAPPPRKSGEGRLEEDQAPDSGALGGELSAVKDGTAYYDDGSYTDGMTWQIGDGPGAMPPPEDTATIDETDPAANPEGMADLGEGTTVGQAIESNVPPRKDVGAGTDHPMEEDEAPDTGANGGQLVDFSGGIARYDDGTETDGAVWRQSTPDGALAASGYVRMKARLFGGGRPFRRAR